VGLLITAAILVVLRDAGREIFRRLMDAVEPQVIEAAEAAITAVTGVRDVAESRLRWIGHSLRAEVGVVLDASLSLAAAHAVCHEVEHALIHGVRRLTAAIVHADPAPGSDRDADQPPAADPHAPPIAHHR